MGGGGGAGGGGGGGGGGAPASFRSKLVEVAPRPGRPGELGGASGLSASLPSASVYDHCGVGLDQRTGFEAA